MRGSLLDIAQRDPGIETGREQFSNPANRPGSTNGWSRQLPLVAALFGCTCCILQVSAATDLAASSSGLMQADDDSPGHAGCTSSCASEYAPGRHAAPQADAVQRNCRMMQRMQLRSLTRR
jgi:hypothetical protein